MKVLITSAGSNTAISVIKALMNLTEKFSIIGTDSNPSHMCAGSKFVEKFFTIPNATQKPDYLNALEQIVVAENVDCIIPIHDVEIEMISGAMDLLSQYCFVATNAHSIVKLCNDKAAANSAAGHAGLQLPKSLSDETHYSFPLIAKPTSGVSSSGLIFIRSEDDLKSFAKQDKRSGYILQELIEGEEYTVDTYSDYKGNFYGGIVRKRIETKAGISTKGVTLDNPHLLSLCKKFLESIEYKGAANLQFIVRDDIPYFIEVNPRFSGAGVLSYEAGFNSPGFTLLEASQKELPPFESLKLKYNLYMTRYWQEIFHQI